MALCHFGNATCFSLKPLTPDASLLTARKVRLDGFDNPQSHAVAPVFKGAKSAICNRSVEGGNQ